MTAHINVFPDGMMEDTLVNGPCWNNAAHPPVSCTLSKDLSDPNTGLRNLKLTSIASATIFHAYGLFPSQTSGPIGGDFPVDLSLYYRTKTLGANIQFQINLKGGGSIDVLVSNDNWTLLDLGDLEVMREGPNGEAILWITGRTMGNPDDFVEVDDIRALQVLDPGTGDKPDFSCWNCDKFQPTDPEIYQTGECRALSPLQFEIAPAAPKDDPLFAGILHAPYTWCAAWKRRQKNQTLPDPPPFAP